MPLIKCRHCGFVIQKPVGIKTDPRTGQRYGADTAQFVTCSRCEGRRMPREGDVMRATLVNGRLKIGTGGEYRAEISSINERQRTARVEVETESGRHAVRLGFTDLEKLKR